MTSVNSLITNFFKDKKGKIVLAQWPNVPLIIWFVGLLVAKTTTGNLQELAGYTSFGALIIWAGLEIFSGVNYFRRALGLTVLILSVYTRITS